MVGSNTRARDHLINRIEQKDSPKISYVISKLVDRTGNVFYDRTLCYTKYCK